jgi:D-xylose transport system permease protein
VLGACTVLLQRTRFGRYVYAIGGNAEAARRAGVSLVSVRTWCFVLAGLISGIAGVLFASWQVSLTTNIIKASNSYVLLAVAAAVIGGTSLFGGRGKTIHGVLGGLVIGGIYNGLYLLSVQSQWIDVVVAAVLLAAALIDVLSRRGAQGQKALPKLAYTRLGPRPRTVNSPPPLTVRGRLAYQRTGAGSSCCYPLIGHEQPGIAADWGILECD